MSDIFYHYEEFREQCGKILHSTKLGLNPSVFESRNCRFYQNSVIIRPDSEALTELRIGYDYLPPTYTIIHRRHNSLFGNFILDGGGSFNGARFLGGDFFYTDPNIKNNIIVSPDSVFHSVWFSVRGNYSELLFRQLKEISPNQILSFNRDRNIKSFFDFFIHGKSIIYPNEAFAEALMSMIITFLSPDPRIDSYKTDAPRRSINIAQKAVRLIEENYTDIDIEKLAEMLYIDRKYLCHEFKAAMGVSPQAFLINCKLNSAVSYLAETDYPIQKIVELTGYNHRNSFSLAFRKRYGCSPAEYRKRISTQSATNQQKC